MSTAHRSGPSGETRSPGLMLAVATIGFAVNFWAWALLSPLGPLFREQGTLGDLTESDVALLVAVPVIVGSLGRIAVGALTDQYGGRVMFPLVSAATIVPILFIGFLGLDSFGALLLGGFFLGIGGTAFAVGVPFVNAWFPPERRGLAIGIFGAGMGGTAISALTTVKLYTERGREGTVPDHRARPGRLRRGGVGGPARRTRPHASGRLARRPLDREREAADHVAGQHPLRRGVRRVRRLLGLPARLPEDRLRPRPGRCRQPHGRVRGGRRPDEACRGMALGPLRCDPGPGRRVRRGGRRRRRGSRAPRCSSTSAPSPS